MDPTKHDSYCLPVFFALLAMFSLSSMHSLVSAAEWPAFRGPNADGTSTSEGIPTEWSDEQNLKWKLKMPGKGFSSPIIVGDYVFVTCYSGADGDLSGLKRHLLCVQRHKGDVVWSKTVPSVAAENRGPSFGTSHGYASHTPVSDGERIFVLFGNSGVFAFDMKGQQIWQQSVGKESASMFGSASSLILHNDRVIVTAAAESESVRALDKKTGKEIWKTEASTLSRCYCTPIILTNERGADELVLSVPNEVWSLNPDNGKLNWYAETRIDLNAVPNIVTEDGIIYVIGGRSGGRTAIRTGGKGDITDTGVLWSTSGGSYVASPVLHNGHLYWFDNRGIAHCVDTKTGEEVSRKRIGGQFYASAVLVNDKLYAVSRFGGTYVFEATPELNQVAHNKLSDESDFSGSPAVSDRQLILRSDEYLYCIEDE